MSGERDDGFRAQFIRNVLEAAAREGRNVMPHATDDQAHAIEASALQLLWTHDVLALLERVAALFEDTDAPLGVEARRLLRSAPLAPDGGAA